MIYTGPTKVIIIKRCFECVYVNSNEGHVACEMFMYGGGYRIVRSDPYIPEWCPLDDWKETT